MISDTILIQIGFKLHADYAEFERLSWHLQFPITELFASKRWIYQISCYYNNLSEADVAQN